MAKKKNKNEDGSDKTVSATKENPIKDAAKGGLDENSNSNSGIEQEKVADEKVIVGTTHNEFSIKEMMINKGCSRDEAIYFIENPSK